MIFYEFHLAWGRVLFHTIHGPNWVAHRMASFRTSHGPKHAKPPGDEFLLMRGNPSAFSGAR